MFVRSNGIQAGLLPDVQRAEDHRLYLRVLWKVEMNLLAKVKTMVDGVKNLTIWVGSGGVVVAQEVAQARADICFTCPLNRRGMGVTAEVAEATLKFLEFKNSLDLRVEREAELHHCFGCGCVLKLLIWEPQDRILSQMTGEETAITPGFCWKMKRP